MRRTQIFLLFFLLNTYVQSRAQKYSAQDTLRGSITPERIWWDLVYYDLDVTVQPKVKSIRGTNTIHYKVVSPNNIMQIDLQPPMKLIKAVQDEVELSINQNGNAHFIQLEKKQNRKKIEQIVLHFEGQPKEAINAPWDGGFSWKKDYNDNDFIATSCQGIGASVWWPNKDHMYDEVDSLQMKITVPKHLKAVGNGRLRAVTKNEKTASYTWFVSNPINNYGVNINIGDYVDFSETYNGEKGNLDMHYFVLKDNLSKAKKQFLDAPKMMKAFEYWFGPYPFYEDSFKLVEVPYLGMEHQSSVTYGNQFKNGYLGTDLSRTGWGLKFDFIIIHESGHEWFANNITYKDAADMWIHEGFTAYSESLFLDYYYGTKAASEYVIGTRSSIRNDKPIIGVYNVNSEGSSDMYYKGANMLHTLRQIIKNDDKWRQILRGLNTEFHHQTVTTKQIESYISNESGLNLEAFFDQYLRDTRIPTLEYRLKDNILSYRWTQVVNGFEMPIEINFSREKKWLYPTEVWQEIELNSTEIDVDIDYYIKYNKVQ